MYKLFLCLRYLRSKVLAWFAVLAVALCVAMMLIVTSVMNGFLDKIETAAKGLFGDIVVSDESGAGLGRYDEFIAVAAGGAYPLRWTDVPAARQDGATVFRAAAADLDAWALRQAAGEGEPAAFRGSAELVREGTPAERVPGAFTLGQDGQLTFRPDEAPAGEPPELAIRAARVALPAAVPEVKAGTPFIWAWGVLRLAPSPWDLYGGRYQQGVQVAGVRLPERARVTDFEEGLFVQDGQASCTFTPPVAQTREALQAEQARLRGLLEREQADLAGGETTSRQTFKRLTISLSQLRVALASLEHVAAARRRARQLEREIERLRRLGAGPERLAARVEELQEMRQRAATEDYSIILGLGLGGLSFRTDRGEVFRWAYPGRRVVLDVFPLGRPSADVLAKQPEQRMLVVADDNRSGVASIDAHIVYLPFETLQRMNHMEPVRAAGDPRRILSPGRTTQIHLKVAAGVDGEPALLRVCDRLRALYERFAARDPVGAVQADKVSIETWRQAQTQVVGPLEAQRVLFIVMIAVISSVSVVLVFVIFYMMVVQKTRDIGVLKAVGASSRGVAGIFLAYGVAIGLVGSVLGTILGWVFVRNINPIHDWVGRTTGLVIWSRETFMFDTIPNEVHAGPAGLIVAGAIVAGLVGALLPALRAARMQPVEALRYE